MEKSPIDGFKKISAALGGAFATPFVVPPALQDESIQVIMLYIVIQGVIDIVKVWRQSDA